MNLRAVLVLTFATLAACDSKAPAPTVAPAHPAAASFAGHTLHVFVWSDYLLPEVKEAFEKETGARVAETNFSNNEEMSAKLVLGGSGFDLVCPSDYAVQQLVKAGVLDEIDAAKVPNLANLSKRFVDPPYDRGNRHSVPYQWGITGIAWRRDSVKDPPKSWKDLFDETKLAAWSGRISMLDDRRECVAAALLARGHSPNSTDPKEIAEAGAMLAKQKDFVARYNSDDYQTTLADRSMLVAHGWNGQFAGAAAEDDQIAFAVPEEGALTYVDNWAVVKGAKEKDLALAFVDFLLRPEIAAKACNARRYASVNEAAKALIDPAILNGMAYQDDGRKLFWLEDLGAAEELYKQLWAGLTSK